MSEPDEFTVCHEAVGAAVQGRTYPVLDRGATKVPEGASAVAVKIGQRLFLATAGHVIQDGRPLELISDTGSMRILEAARKGVWCDWCDEYDYGYIELAPDDSLPIHNFTPTEDLVPAVDYSESVHVVVGGWPTQKYAPTAHQEVAAHPYNAWSVLVPPGEWPRKRLAYRPADSEHLYVRYPDDPVPLVVACADLRQPRHEGDHAPIWPQGMSGGGIWAVPMPDGTHQTIWRPRPTLLGLLAGILKESRLLHGNTIALWLNLVAQDYTDLRQEIAQVLPERLRTGW